MTKTKPFKKLAAILSARRNLEAALTPPDQIGIRYSGLHWQSDNEQAKHLAESRKRHKRFIRDVRALHGIRSRKQHLAKIQELQAQEAILWHACRPDIH